MVRIMVCLSDIFTVGAPGPAVAIVPIGARYGAPTIARGGQWIAFFVKFDRFIGRVVIGAELALFAPHAIGATRETIKQGFLMAYWRVAVKTIDCRMRVKLWVGIVLHGLPLML